MALREPGGTVSVTHLPAPSCIPAAPGLAQPLHRAIAPGAARPCSPCATTHEGGGHVLGKLGWRKRHQGWRSRETMLDWARDGLSATNVLSSWHPAMHVYKVVACKGAACSPWAHNHAESLELNFPSASPSRLPAWPMHAQPQPWSRAFPTNAAENGRSLPAQGSARKSMWMQEHTCSALSCCVRDAMSPSQPGPMQAPLPQSEFHSRAKRDERQGVEKSNPRVSRRAAACCQNSPSYPSTSHLSHHSVPPGGERPQQSWRASACERSPAVPGQNKVPPYG